MALLSLHSLALHKNNKQTFICNVILKEHGHLECHGVVKEYEDLQFRLLNQELLRSTVTEYCHSLTVQFPYIMKMGIITSNLTDVLSAEVTSITWKWMPCVDCKLIVTEICSSNKEHQVATCLLNQKQYRCVYAVLQMGELVLLSSNVNWYTSVLPHSTAQMDLCYYLCRETWHVCVCQCQAQVCSVDIIWVILSSLWVFSVD